MSDSTVPSHAAAPKPYFSDSTYDRLKFIAMIVLPAVGALYFALAGIWGLPAANEVVGTITALDTLLGVLLGVSTSKYNASDAKYDGTIDVVDTGEKKVFSMTLNSDPEELEQKPAVTFKVTPPQ